MEIRVIEVSAPDVVAALEGLFGAASAPAPKSDADLLSEAASQIITIANRIGQQPVAEEWYPEDLPERMSWTAAKDAVAKLGDGWRLPTDKEWEAEIDRSKFNPALRNAEKLPGIKSEGYWTSTPGASGPQCSAWVVYLNCGDVLLHHQDNRFWVRPVRAARRAPSQ